MRLVFALSTDEFEDEARRAWPDAVFKPREFCSLGPTAYVVYDPEDGYLEKWFRGVGVRMRAMIRARPLQAGGALYLPVKYDAWAVLVDGPASLGAALEAARALHLQTVVCPAFDASSVAAAKESCGFQYDRKHDRILKKNVV